jgi:hypothetical protein
MDSLSGRPEKFGFRSYRDGKALSSVELPEITHIFTSIGPTLRSCFLRIANLGGASQFDSAVTGIFCQVNIEGVLGVLPSF